MTSYSYDFHIHSCLSPCGDDDMTVNNIAGMAALNRLSIAAITDHNSCKNCPAFFAAAKRNGIVPVAGMELTTAEEIHLVCLFETLDSAMNFDKAVYSHLPDIKNNEAVFGSQLILDADDNVIGKEEKLLVNATTLSLEEAFLLVKEDDGICFPAHIDREANGILAVLGDFPVNPDFSFFELNDRNNFDRICEKYPILLKKKMLASSDAHYLHLINDDINRLELENSISSADTRAVLFRHLRSTAQS